MNVRILISLCLLILAACGQAPSTANPLQSGLTNLATTNLAEIDAAVDKNDREAAQAAFEEFHEGWEAVEDGVKDVSADSYQAIEEAMEQVKDAVVRDDTLNAVDAKAATAALRQEIETFASTLK